MYTRIIIKHETVEALKASPLWAHIMDVAFVDGSVEVVEISRIKQDPDADTPLTDRIE